MVRGVILQNVMRTVQGAFLQGFLSTEDMKKIYAKSLTNNKHHELSTFSPITVQTELLHGDFVLVLVDIMSTHNNILLFSE